MSATMTAIATKLSAMFMPAEKDQRSAAMSAARSLVAALELEEQPGFQNVRTGPAKEALVRGVQHAVAADDAFREAHRRFAKMLPSTPLADNGWGCTTPTCDDDSTGLNVHPIHSAA